VEWSWKSHEFSLQVVGGPVAGPPLLTRWIRGVQASDSAPTTVVIGASGEVLDRTDPGYEPGTGSLKALAKAWRKYSNIVTGAGAVRLSSLDFKLVIKAMAGLELPLIDTIEFAFTEIADDRAVGSADATETDLTIQCTKILRNGVQL
jgi:hypothetical protein